MLNADELLRKKERERKGVTCQSQSITQRDTTQEKYRQRKVAKQASQSDMAARGYL